jgi:hypothetical protein
LARRIGYCFQLPHAKKKEITHGEKGDYVIQPENGKIEDQYIVLANHFHEKYQVVGGFSEYTELLKGIIMVSPSKELKRANSSSGEDMMHVSAERYKVATLGFMNESVRNILTGTGVSSETKSDVSATSSLNENVCSPEKNSTVHQTPIEEPSGTAEELGVGSWDFDLFQLNKETRHWPLFHLAHHIFFERTNLVEALGVDAELLNDFFAEIDDTYLPVAYHNNMHGSDVLHGCHFMVEKTQLKDCITPGEHFSFLIAGMCHDLSHPGTNNMFQVDSQSTIAMMYNDVSVLENFHITTTFEILRQKQYEKMIPVMNSNVKGSGGSGSSSDSSGSIVEMGGRKGQTHWIDLHQFRKIIIQTILATDLAERNKYYREWDERALGANGEDKKNLNIQKNFADRLLFMSMAIKCCDLKHPTLIRGMHLRWSEMVNEGKLNFYF